MRYFSSSVRTFILTRYDFLPGNRRLGAEESNRLRRSRHFGTCRQVVTHSSSKSVRGQAATSKTLLVLTFLDFSDIGMVWHIRCSVSSCNSKRATTPFRRRCANRQVFSCRRRAAVVSKKHAVTKITNRRLSTMI
jgi:hypothetical protein